jgi:hypothetical protein
LVSANYFYNEIPQLWTFAAPGLYNLTAVLKNPRNNALTASTQINVYISKKILIPKNSGKFLKIFIFYIKVPSIALSCVALTLFSGNSLNCTLVVQSIEKTVTIVMDFTDRVEVQNYTSKNFKALDHN